MAGGLGAAVVGVVVQRHLRVHGCKAREGSAPLSTRRARAPQI
jgi:hypothetical protein